MIEIKGKHNSATVFADNIDEETIAQILNLCNQEWAKDSIVKIMPDTHAGKGCTIGTTMTIKNKVCPNLVGVDIGCGMLTIKLPDIELDLEKIDQFIHENIPSGFASNSKRMFDKFYENIELDQLKCFDNLENIDMLYRSIGSLGGGNHFIEIDQDKSDKYLIIHSGSRNLGKQVAEYYQEIAIKNCKEIKNKDLAYLEGYSLNDYLHDMRICQRYASLNRQVIGRRILEHILGQTIKVVNSSFICEQYKIESFETIHNYIDLESMILRKGAISAKKDEIVLIPINMRDGAIIGKGKGNKEYNYSGPHGAGRLMSRKEAKINISMEEYKKTMQNIYTTSVSTSTIDESPMVYKPIDQIIEHIQDSIEIVKIIKPIYNFKAH